MVVLDEGLSDLNREKRVLLRTYVGARVLEVGEAKSLCRWSILSQLVKIQVHAMLLDYHLISSIQTYVRRRRVGSQYV